MTGFIHEIETISEKYGLKISSIDVTDVTVMARLELLPSIFIQVYRNFKKNKLNMALILGRNRIYGFDSEGGIAHEHPKEDPESHVLNRKEPEIEEFVLNCFNILKDKDLL